MLHDQFRLGHSHTAIEGNFSYSIKNAGFRECTFGIALFLKKRVDLILLLILDVYVYGKSWHTVMREHKSLSH